MPIATIGLLAALPPLAVVGALAVPAADAAVVSVVFPPGTPPAEAVSRIAAADGRPVAAAGLPGAWLVRAETAGLADRLYRAGAWLVLDAGNAAGCTPARTPAGAER